MIKKSTVIVPEKVVPALRGTVADMLKLKGNVVHSIPPDATVLEAIARMDERRVGALLVVDASGRLVGILSERDYTRKVILQGRASRDTRVDEIMTPQVLTVAPTTSLRECLALVADRSIRHLPVVVDGTVLGVLSVGDLVRAVLEQQAETIQTLNAFIGSDYPQ